MWIPQNIISKPKPFSTNMNINVAMAKPEWASHIASLIMEAMNAECCQNFAGPSHTLADFHNMMTRLVEMDDSQYSYRNTLCALTPDGELAGICVAYDGGKLHALRKRFVEAAREAFGIDYSDMDDETEAGEFYIDSLAVSTDYRGKGIAKQLLRAAIERGEALGLARVGLLVDKGNPRAEALYNKVGFAYVNDTAWGGHPMKHLQYTTLK